MELGVSTDLADFFGCQTVKVDMFREVMIGLTARIKGF